MRVTVRVQPGARQTRVGGRYGETDPPVLLLRVTAPAVDGRANDAARRALAAAFDVAPRDVTIVRGETSRTKLVDITGGDPDRLRALLESRTR